jgi:hypothetical protein
MDRFKDLPPTPVTGGDFIPSDLSLPVSPADAQLHISRPDSSTLPSSHFNDVTPTATSDTRRSVALENDNEKEEDEESAEHLSSESQSLSEEYPLLQALIVQPSHARPRPLTGIPTPDTPTVSFPHASVGWLDLSASTSPLPPPVPPKDPKVSSRVKQLPLPLRLPSSEFGSML